MGKRVIIYGSSGHGRVIWDLAQKQNRFQEICFLDDDPKAGGYAGSPVIGDGSYSAFQPGDEMVVAVGNGSIRARIQEIFGQKGVKMAVLVHPDSTIGAHVTLGDGTVVMAGVVINSGAVIKEGCIINTASSVDHDCVLEPFCHVAVGAHLAGGVRAGAFTWIGAGAVVSNHVTLCANCMVGAGTVVVRDLTEPGTYVGVPARRIGGVKTVSF